MALAQKESALSLSEIRDSMKKLPLWTLQARSIVREFSFKDFREAMDFVNRVAEVAEAADHHPDIFILYNKVKLEFSTHTAGGLTPRDFETAAKVDSLWTGS